MSSKKKRNDVGSGPGENIDIEDKINAAMDKIMKDPEEERNSSKRKYEPDNGESETEEYESEERYDSEEYESDEAYDSEEEYGSQEEHGEDAEYDEEGYDEPEEEGSQDFSRNIKASGKLKSARPQPVKYVPMDDIEEKLALLPENKRKKHKGLKITGLAAAMAVVVAGCAYAGMTYYYSDRFFEGTWINGIDCSGKTAYEVETALADKVQDYSIQVSSRNQEPQMITGEQINYQYLSTGETLQLLKNQKPYEWIKGFYEQKSYTVAENVAYDKTLLQQQVTALNCAKTENQTAPENAYVAFKDNQFQIVPETEGTQLNVKQAYRILDQAVADTQASIDFGTAPDAYVSAEVTQNDPELQSALEACNNYTKASITYTFGEQTATLDGNTIKDWLQFDEKGQLLMDDNTFHQHIADYVAQLAATYNTVGTEREFHTTSGRTVYVYSSVYGWAIDQAAEAAQLAQEIQSGTQTTREPIYEQTANSHGLNDLGNTYIEVDLSNQHMYYYQSGSLIFDSEFVSGNMSYSDRQTHAGIFTLYSKTSPSVLRGDKKPDGTYEYEEPVDYWMPFDGGIGFHDAPWRDAFGGDIYLTNGSHGCINLPPENAAVLYSIIDYNVPIVCFY
ncbi:MAG: peptidoglycan binding domain-containing protein [Lachnospiraceae bacterium]|nr:peptidoglycan binding domain-containing protein [Lachnospiraceae bacterium]